MEARFKYALESLLIWIGEGRRLSEASNKQKKLVTAALKLGYVESSRIRNDYIISPTGRVP